MAKTRFVSPIEESLDFVQDVAVILRSVRVVNINYAMLDNAIHSKVKAADLIKRAEDWFKTRKPQRDINFLDLVESFK